jgi:hypothetical protein
MAKEMLYIPEQHLAEVIEIIREGMKHINTSKSVKNALEKWCAEEEEYLKGMEETEHNIEP